MCFDLSNLFNVREDMTSAELRDAAYNALRLGMLNSYESLTHKASKALARERRHELARIARKVAAARERIHAWSIRGGK